MFDIDCPEIDARYCSAIFCLLGLTNEDAVSEVAQNDQCSVFECFIALKGTFIFLYFICYYSAGVMPCGGPKSLPVHYLLCRLYISRFGPLRSVGLL